MESIDGLLQLLTEMRIAPDSKNSRQLIKYLDLLEKWNARVNLTASTEWSSLKRLFYEGIWASGIYPPEFASHLDIGSGAGFPAIILKILVPHIHLDMVESRKKKSAFLETVVHALDMNGAKVHAERLDSVLRCCEGTNAWDCISWKGVKLYSRDFLALRRYAHSHTQFWMFHGGEPAVEEPEILEKYFTLIRKEQFPGNKDWALSMYVLR
jgi:16S rRNA (guanine(527)-N(7))-methyltransferase RsmG